MDRLSRLETIRLAARLPTEKRTDENLDDIVEFVKDVKFFPKLNIAQRRALSSVMAYEYVPQHGTVFSEGDEGDKFYIILTGCVGVQVSGGAVFLEAGMGFGELALQDRAPRSATTLASEDTELLTITCDDYEQYAGREHREFIANRVRFLRQCGNIEEALINKVFTLTDIEVMAGCLKEQSLVGGQLVVKQGDVVDHAIFVRSGQLAIVKSLKGDEMRSAASSPARGGTKRSTSPKEKPQQSMADKLLVEIGKVRKQKQPGGPELSSEGEGGYGEEGRTPKAALKSGQHGSGGSDKLASQKLAGSFSPTRRSKEVSSGTPTGSKSAAASEKDRSKPSAWTKVGKAVSQAMTMRAFGGALSGGYNEKDQVAKSKKHIKHVVDANKIKRRLADKEAQKSTVERRREERNNRRVGTTTNNILQGKKESEGSEAQGSEPLLLWCGTLGPHQYFGDITKSEVYPASLVGSPVAELFLITKQDLQRRLPKALAKLLFDKLLPVPPDQQLIDMHRQAKRWDQFKQGLHSEARFFSKQSEKAATTLRSLPSQSDKYITSNLDFLGVINPEAHAKRIGPMRPPPRQSDILTQNDQEHFSQSNSIFLRRFKEVKKDMAKSQITATAGIASEDKDPMRYVLEQYWDRLDADIGIDLRAEFNIDGDVTVSDIPSRGLAVGDGDAGRRGLRMPSKNQSTNLPSEISDGCLLVNGNADHLVDRRHASRRCSAVQTVVRGKYQRPMSSLSTACPTPMPGLSSPSPPPGMISSGFCPPITSSGRWSPQESAQRGKTPVPMTPRQVGTPRLPSYSPEGSSEVMNTSRSLRKTVAFDSVS